MSDGRMTNGAAGAAILSTGIGCLVVGVLAVTADGSKAVARALTFCTPTGPLSGVTTLAIIVWLAVWVVLAWRWSAKTVAMGRVNLWAFVCLAIGLLLTFPPFGDLLLGR